MTAAKSFVAMAITAILLDAASSARSQEMSSWLARFNAWCCKYSNFGCTRTAARVFRTRGNPEARPHGGTLMRLDLRSHVSVVLWANCGCWSPTPMTPGSLAVTTNSGIFLVQMDMSNNRKMIFHGEGVRELLGTKLTPNHTLLFLRTSTDPNCEFEPWELYGKSFAAQPVPNADDLACGKDLDFKALLKPDQISGGKTLFTLRYRGKYEIDEHSDGPIRPLFSDETSPPDRFDPIWIDSSSIAFVTQP